MLELHNQSPIERGLKTIQIGFSPGCEVTVNRAHVYDQCCIIPHDAMRYFRRTCVMSTENSDMVSAMVNDLTHKPDGITRDRIN